MDPYVNDLREQRRQIAEEARTILSKAGEEKRSLTSEEREKVDRIHADVDKLGAEVDLREKQDGLDATLGRSIARVTESMKPGETKTINLRSIANEDYVPGRVYEARELAKSSAPGALDVQVASSFEQAMSYFGPMWRVATILRTQTGNSLNMPTVNDTGNSGALLAEAGTVTTADPTFGSVVFGAYKYESKAVLVSNELLQDSTIPLESLIARQLAERIARATNTAFTTKTDGPTGIATTQSGCTTVATAAATNALVYADVVELVHGIDPAYRVGASFMMSDGIVAVLRYLVDSNNRPLWEPNVQAGQPDRLLGYPVFINNAMTAAPTSGSKSIIFGDLSKYMIRQAGDLQIVVAKELYVANWQTGYFGFLRVDGNLLDAGVNPVGWLVQA
jgi:HK97 family phage major capsid protein